MNSKFLKASGRALVATFTIFTAFTAFPAFAQQPILEKSSDCMLMALVAEEAAKSRDRGFSRQQAADEAVKEYHNRKLFGDRIRAYAGRVFDAPIPSQMAAAEAYSACALNWPADGIAPLKLARVVKMGECIENGAPGVAFACGIREALYPGDEWMLPIPAAFDLELAVERAKLSTVLIRWKNGARFGVVVPGGRSVIAVLGREVTTGEGVTVSPSAGDPRWQEAKVVGVDPDRRIAIIEPPPKEVAPAPIADVGRLDRGQLLVAMDQFAVKWLKGRLVTLTNSHLVESTLTGMPSCGGPYLEMVSAHPQANVDGPVFDLEGRLAGFGSLVWKGKDELPYYRNVGYPADLLMHFGDRVRRDGKIRFGSIGVTILAVTADYARTAGLPDASGTLVKAVATGGGAAKAGLEPGDVILAVNDRRIVRYCELINALQLVAPGENVKLKVWRQGAERTLNAVAQEVPQRPQGP